MYYIYVENNLRRHNTHRYNMTRLMKQQAGGSKQRRGQIIVFVLMILGLIELSWSSQTVKTCRSMSLHSRRELPTTVVTDMIISSFNPRRNAPNNNERKSTYSSSWKVEMFELKGATILVGLIRFSKKKQTLARNHSLVLVWDVIRCVCVCSSCHLE